jgi:hypothetical protein
MFYTCRKLKQNWNKNIIHLQFKLVMFLKYLLFVILSRKFLALDVRQRYNVATCAPD